MDAYSDDRSPINASSNLTETSSDANSNFSKKKRRPANTVETVDVDEAFELVGAFGWYQFVQSFVNTVVNGATMFFFNAFAFLEVSPQLECELTPGVITYTNSTNEA